MGRTMYANSIAERKLLYASINTQEMREVTVRVYAPVPLKDGDVSFKFDQGESGCDTILKASLKTFLTWCTELTPFKR